MIIMTANEIIKKIGVGKTNSIDLSKRNSKVKLWWDDRDKWFCNILYRNETEPFMVTEKDLEHHIDFNYLQDNFKYKNNK